MTEPWRMPFPDLTTETIDRIEVELTRTQEFREQMNRDAVCVVCKMPGIHVHYF